MIGHKFSLKLLSVVAVLSFVSIGSARAADAPELCENSGGAWSENTCTCPVIKHLVFDENEKQCVCASGYVVQGGECVLAAQISCEAQGSDGTWANDGCSCKQGYLFDSRTGQCYKATANEVQDACTGSGGTWGSDCKCEKENSVFKNGYCVCKYGYVIDGGSSLGDENATCVRDTGMKLATTAYNNARFAGVQTDLNNAITKIKSVVVQALANTTKITTVATNKQTRPADDYTDPANTINCPSGKKCLLVTAPDQTPHWYEIVDCGEDSVLGNMTYVDVNMSGFGPGEPWGFKTSSGESNLMCLSNVFGCQNSEWMTPYDASQGTSGDEIVFGNMRRVSIAEQTRGAIVSLPNNVQSGNVCVCKATRYKVWDSGTSSYCADRTITTDKWFVAGVANSDDACLSSCGRENAVTVTKEAYLAEIANSCAGSAAMANMCIYHSFFARAAVTPPEHYGFVVNGERQIDCQTNGYFANNSHCGENGSWVAEYEQNGILGYVYGTVGYATVPNGTTQYSVVDLGLSDVSTSPSGKNAVLCVIQGYKPAADANDTVVSFNKSFVISVGDLSNATSAGLSAWSRSCANAVGSTSGAGYTQAMTWYNTLADMCYVGGASSLSYSIPVVCGSNSTLNTSTGQCECNSGYHDDNGVCVQDITCGANAHLNNAGTACVCNTGYTEVGGVCVWDCSGKANSHASGTSCVCDSGYTEVSGACVWDCSGKAHSHAVGTTCVCDTNYTEQNGVCVQETQQQTCDSSLRSACTNSGGTWTENTCSCSCSNKTHSTLNAAGSCVCNSGYTEQNGSCVQETQQQSCNGTVIESLIEPGSLREGGEAWVDSGQGLWGGKACDGRWASAGIPNVLPHQTNSCLENEWLHVHQNVAVYGEVKVVAINQDTPGTIVSLPNNVTEVNTAGGVCVCKVTAYAPALSSDSNGNPTSFGDRTSINTGNKWIIAGRRTHYGENETPTQACITDCAFYTDSPSLISYYDYVGNACTSVTASNATSCNVADPKTTTVDPYMTFVNAAVDNKWATVQSIGFAAQDKSGTGLCANNNAAYCQKATGDLTGWAMQVYMSDPNKYFNKLGVEETNPYNGQVILYGRARCVTKGEAFSKLKGDKGMMVSLANVPENSESGTVCIQNIAGYQRSGDKAATSLNSTYWYAKNYETAEACLSACAPAEASSEVGQQMLSTVGEMSEPVGGMCLTDE